MYGQTHILVGKLQKIQLQEVVGKIDQERVHMYYLIMLLLSYE